jgi:hypothetical protein
MIAVLLSAAPDKYHSVLMVDQHMHGTVLTVDHLEDVMNALWIQV